MSSEDINIGIEAQGADEAADQINNVTSAVKGLNDVPTTGIRDISANLDTIRNSAQGVNQPITSATTGVQSLSQAYEQVAVKGQEMDATVRRSGEGIGTASTNFKTFATTLTGAVSSISGVALGVLSMVSSYTQMERAQSYAERASIRYQQAVQTENNIRDKLNKLIADGNGNTAEAQKLQDQLALAEQRTAQALDASNISQERANESAAYFFLQLLPSGVAIVSGIAQAIVTLPTAFNTMKTAVTAAGDAIHGTSSAISTAKPVIEAMGSTAEGAATGVKSLGTSFAGVMAVVGIAAAIAAAVVLASKAIVDNSKAIHDWGYSIANDVGKTIPEAKTGIQGLTDAFVDSANFVTKATTIWTDSLGLTKDAWHKATGTYSEMVTQYVSGSKEMGGAIQAQIEGDLKWAHQQGISTEQFIANVKRQEDNQKKANQATQQAAEDLKHYQEVIKMTGDSLEKDLTGHLTGLNTALTGIMPGWEKFGDAGTTLRTVFTELGKELDNFGSKSNKTTDDYVKFGTEVNKTLTELKPKYSELGSTVTTIVNEALDQSSQLMKGNTDAAIPLEQTLARLDTTVGNVGKGVEQMNLSADPSSIQSLTSAAQIANSEFASLASPTGGIGAVNGKLVQFGSYVGEIGNGIKGLGTILNGEFIPASTGMSKAVEEQSIKTKMAADATKLHREALVETVAQYIGYNEASKLTNAQLEEFKKAVDDGSDALKTMNVDLVAQQTSQQQTNRLQNESALAYAEVKKAQLDQIDTIAKLKGTLAADEENIKNHTTAINDMAEGYLKSKDDIMTWAKSLDTSIGSAKGTHDGLQTLINDWGVQIPKGINMTNDQMKTWIGIMKGAPEQIDKLNQSIDSLGTEFETGLTAAAKKGGTDLQKFLQDLPELVRKNTPPGILKAAFSEGQVTDFLTQFRQDLGIGLKASGSDPNIIADLHTMVNSYLTQMQQAAAKDPVAAKVFQPIFDALRQNPPTTLEDFQKVFALLDQALTSLKGSAEGSGLGLAKIPGPLGQIPAAADPATKAAAAFSKEIENWGGLATVAQQTFLNISKQAATLATELGASARSAASNMAPGFGQIATVAQQTFNNVRSQADQLASQLGSAARSAASNMAPGFGSMATTAQQTFNNMNSQAQTLVTQLGTTFKSLSGSIAPAFGEIATLAQRTFQNMVSQAQQAARQIQQAFQQAMSVQQGAYGSQASYYSSPYGSYGGQYNYTGYTPYTPYYAQHGFVGVVDKPTTFIAGEAGPEYVSIVPGGGAGGIGATMILGLNDMVASIRRTNDAMTVTFTAANKNTAALNNATLTIIPLNQSLANSTKALDENETAVLTMTNTADTTTTSLNDTTTAANDTTSALYTATGAINPITPAFNNTTTAANNTTGSLNNLDTAINSTANAMQQIPAQFMDIYNRMQQGVQASAFAAYAQYGSFGGGAAGGGGGGGGGAAYYGPAAFAPYAQYGSFSYGTPTSGQPGAPGVYPGAGGGGASRQYGPFGAYAQYGQFGGSSPAPSGGAAYYGGPPAGYGSSPYGAFGAYSQYGQFGGGGSAGGSPQAAPGAAYYGGPPSSIYQPSPYGTFGGYSQYGNFGGGSPQQTQAASSGHSPTQGGTLGSQGQGAYQQQASPASYGGGGGAYYGAPTYRSNQYGQFGGYSPYGNFSPYSGQNAVGTIPYGYGGYGGQAQQQPQANYYGGAYSPSYSYGANPWYYATGFEGIVRQATSFIAGEAGPEYVSVKPIRGGSNSNFDVSSIIEMIAEMIRQLRNQSININVNSILDGYTIYRNQQKYTSGRYGNYLG